MGFEQKQLRQLRAKLKPRHVRVRIEDGVTLHYLEGWHVIAEANRIFGFDGWDRQAVESTCVYTKHLGVRFEAVYVARVRITVKADGVVIMREGSGTGEASTTSPGKAHELALKAAETDATKRALMTFGNAFGLSLYDPNNPVRDSVAPHANDGDARKTELSGSEDGDHSQDRTIVSVGDAEEGAQSHDDTTNGHSHREVPNGIALDGAMPRLAPPSQQADTDPNKRPIAKTNGHASEANSRARSDDFPAADRQDRIDKSTLTLSEPKRHRDPEHLRFVVKHGCVVCGRNRTHAHHLTFAQPHALGRKVSDEYTVPLCARHHQELHQAGNEEDWWRAHKLDPLAIADDLWDRSRRATVRV